MSSCRYICLSPFNREQKSPPHQTHKNRGSFWAQDELFHMFDRKKKRSRHSLVLDNLKGRVHISPIYYSPLSHWRLRWPFLIGVTLLEFTKGEEFHRMPIRRESVVLIKISRLKTQHGVTQVSGTLNILQVAMLAPCFSRNRRWCLCARTTNKTLATHEKQLLARRLTTVENLAKNMVLTSQLQDILNCWVVMWVRT